MLIDGMLLGLMIVMKLIGIPVSIRLCYFEHISPNSWNIPMTARIQRPSST